MVEGERRRPGGAAGAMFEADVASRGLGLELLDAGGGTAVVRMRVGPAMINGHGIAHGGYLFLLADTAFACACNSRGGSPSRPAPTSRSSPRSGTATC